MRGFSICSCRGLDGGGDGWRSIWEEIIFVRGLYCIKIVRQSRRLFLGCRTLALLFFVFLVAHIFEARLQKNLAHENVGVCRSDGSTVCEGFPCACVVLCVDEGDGEGTVAVSVLRIPADGITQGGGCLRRIVLCKEDASVVVEGGGIIGRDFEVDFVCTACVF